MESAIAKRKNDLYRTDDKNSGLLSTTFDRTLQYGWVKAR
jgi:hypothetical protein